MITRKEFGRRRKQLMRMMGKDSIAIIPTATELLRNRDVEFPFRADSDFYYLTGFHEPDAVAVLIPGGRMVSICYSAANVTPKWRPGPASAPVHRELLTALMLMMPFRSVISTRSCPG